MLLTFIESLHVKHCIYPPDPTATQASSTVQSKTQSTHNDIPTTPRPTYHPLRNRRRRPHDPLASPRTSRLRTRLILRRRDRSHPPRDPNLPPQTPSSGYAKTLLIYPPSPSPTTTTPPNPAQPCAGFALYFPSYSTWRAAPGLYLEDLFVRPAYRGRGYGTALLKRLAQETTKIGGQRLEWSVLKWNEPSIKFYEGVGAKMKNEWVGMRVEGEEVRRMAEDGIHIK